MAETPQTDLGETVAWAAAAELDELHDLRAELDVRIATQAMRAVHGLRLHVAERELTDEHFSTKLVKRLYWECPDVRVGEIAKALGFRSAHQVIAAAGPGHFAQPCRGGCGTTVERTVKSRSDANATGHSHTPWTDPRLCPACQADRLAQHEQDSARWRADFEREDRERLEALRRVRAEGGQPIARYVEYSGLGGTYLDPDFELPADA